MLYNLIVFLTVFENTMFFFALIYKRFFVLAKSIKYQISLEKAENKYFEQLEKESIILAVLYVLCLLCGAHII